MATGFKQITAGTSARDKRANDTEAGILPELLLLNRPTLRRNGIYSYDHLDPKARSFTLLRSQLLHSLDMSKSQVIAITSTQPGNGKSFVAANLAVSLGRVHHTILLDLDLHRPTLANRFGLPSIAGVDDYLAGDTGLMGALCQLLDTDLSILPVRNERDDATELLFSPRLSQLFEELRAQPGNPICIVDTPPTLALEDILLISQHLDGVLLVVEEGRTTVEDLREAVSILAPTPVLGTILNKSLTSHRKANHTEYYGRQ